MGVPNGLIYNDINSVHNFNKSELFITWKKNHFAHSVIVIKKSHRWNGVEKCIAVVFICYL